jgi:hypothetical protein
VEEGEGRGKRREVKERKGKSGREREKKNGSISSLLFSSLFSSLLFSSLLSSLLFSYSPTLSLSTHPESKAARQRSTTAGRPPGATVSKSGGSVFDIVWKRESGGTKGMRKEYYKYRKPFCITLFSAFFVFFLLRAGGERTAATASSPSHSKRCEYLPKE